MIFVLIIAGLIGLNSEIFGPTIGMMWEWEPDDDFNEAVPGSRKEVGSLDKILGDVTDSIGPTSNAQGAEAPLGEFPDQSTLDLGIGKIRKRKTI